MKDLFKPEDFICAINHNLTLSEGTDGKYISLANVLYVVNKKLNALIESWPVVYTKPGQKDQNGHDINFWKTFQHFGVNTHKARLAFIEEIVKEPCKHEPDFLKWGYEGQKCKHCGAELVAEWKQK